MMKRLIYILIISLAALLSISCSNRNYGDISVEGYKLRKFSRLDDRTYELSATLNLNNRGPKFSADQIVGQVNYKNTALGTFFFDPVTVQKGICDVDFNGKLSVDSSVSLVKLIVIARSFNASDFTFDLSAVCKAGIGKVKIEKKEIPLTSLLKK